MVKFSNNERGELEDQMAKCSKEIFELEQQNKTLETKNQQLENEIETCHKKLLEKLEPNHGKLDNDDPSSDVSKFHETISNLEERLEQISSNYERTKAEVKERLELENIDLQQQVSSSNNILFHASFIVTMFLSRCFTALI